MKYALFFDTETTGLPDFKLPSGSDGQPHIVQIATALLDMETREKAASLDLVIKPDGWEITEEAA